MTSSEQFFQKLDAYIEQKTREMVVRMNLVQVNEVRAKQLGDRLEQTRVELQAEIDSLFHERSLL